MSHLQSHDDPIFLEADVDMSDASIQPPQPSDITFRENATSSPPTNNPIELTELEPGASSSNLHVDLRLLDYVNICDENLVCPICRCPFVDPVILTECNHCFCRDCIRQTWAVAPGSALSPTNNRKECPSCRTPTKQGLRSSTNKILTNILDDMIVKCPNSVDGCAAQIKRGEVQDHVSLYCGFSTIECTASGCKLLSRRKDAILGCLHFDASCLACRDEMHVANLESHWHGQCSDREVDCRHCQTRMLHKELTNHEENSCPGVPVPCPGKSLGCSYANERARSEMHARTCPLAALQPIFAAQKKRLDEQEIAQRQLNKRVKVLENGFSTMRDILYPSDMAGFNSSSSRSASDEHAHSRHQSTSGNTNLAEHFDVDFDPENPLPRHAANGPYNSPVHHLLSMHESLREEMSRMTNALHELEGRQSMQILNENMRSREEIAYLRAQQSRLAHQVQWLTSVQLQQQGQNGPSGAGSAGDMAAAGSKVEAGFSAVNSAVRGLSRMTSSGQERLTVRRGSSEEGRTKL